MTAHRNREGMWLEPDDVERVGEDRCLDARIQGRVARQRGRGVDLKQERFEDVGEKNIKPEEIKRSGTDESVRERVRVELRIDGDDGLDDDSVDGGLQGADVGLGELLSKIPPKRSQGPFGAHVVGHSVLIRLEICLRLLNGIIRQVCQPIAEATLGAVVVTSRETDEALFVHKNDERVVGADQGVNAEIKLLLGNQQRVLHVALYKQWGRRVRNLRFACDHVNTPPTGGGSRFANEGGDCVVGSSGTAGPLGVQPVQQLRALAREHKGARKEPKVVPRLDGGEAGNVGAEPVLTTKLRHPGVVAGDLSGLK
jgi:hypothetical protein